MSAQNGKLRVIAFGAHPDDCDIRAGGTAAKFAAMGHAVKFVSVTNGDAGPPDARAAARWPSAGGAGGARNPAGGSASSTMTLDNHDGELLPTLEVRQQIIRAHPQVERRYRAGAAAQRLSPRPPLHRRAGAGRRLHGGGAQRLPGYAAAAQEPRVLLLRGRLPEARAVPPRRRRRYRRRVARRRWTRSTRTSRRSTSGCPGWTAIWIRCPRTPRRARSGWPAASRRSPRRRRCARRWRSGTAPSAAAKVQHAEAFELCEYGSRPERRGPEAAVPDAAVSRRPVWGGPPGPQPAPWPAWAGEERVRGDPARARTRGSAPQTCFLESLCFGVTLRPSPDCTPGC